MPKIALFSGNIYTAGRDSRDKSQLCPRGSRGRPEWLPVCPGSPGGPGSQGGPGGPGGQGCLGGQGGPGDQVCQCIWFTK